MVLGRCTSDCIVSSMGWLGPCEASLSVSVGTEILRFFDGGIFHRNPNNDARCLSVSTIKKGKVDEVEHGNSVKQSVISKRLGIVYTKVFPRPDW